MKKISYRLLFAFLMLPFLAATSGCVAVVAGGAAAGGTAYVMGELKTDVDGTPKQLRSAIIDGTQSLGLRTISGSGDELQGNYVYRTAADKKVTVRYDMATDQTAELRIRVGTFGDEAMSMRIHEAITRRL